MASRFRSLSKPAFSVFKSTINKPTLKPRPASSLSVSQLGCLQSLLPLHSAVSSARLTSCLGIDSSSSRSLSQELGLSVPRKHIKSGRKYRMMGQILYDGHNLHCKSSDTQILEILSVDFNLLPRIILQIICGATLDLVTLNDKSFLEKLSSKESHVDYYIYLPNHQELQTYS
ncbi:hypothetical protein REPUB_Repub18cG0145200 [Reevesia pubescens]